MSTMYRPKGLLPTPIPIAVLSVVHLPGAVDARMRLEKSCETSQQADLETRAVEVFNLFL